MRTIKSAYRQLAMQFHPDKNPGCGDSEARFKAISQAYDCLKDPQKRAAYDRFGHAAFENGGMGGGGGGAGFSDIGDIFESIFGNAFGGGGRQQARRGADLRYDMEIGLDEAFHGKHARDRDRGLAGLRALRRQRAPSPAPARAAATCAAATARSAPSRASSWSSAPARPATAAAR